MLLPDGKDRIILWEGRSRNKSGGSRCWIVRAFEDSPQPFETDYIDVQQLHCRDWETDLEESLSAMTDLQRAAKIRVIGTSATSVEWIVEAQRVSEQRHLARVRSE